MAIGLTLLIALGVIALYFIFSYNRLVILQNRVEEAWSDIDVQLKRRYNLIPNLVETVKGYAEHEKGTFEEITKARTKAMQAGSPGERTEAENHLSETLKSLFAVSENYPELRASENFLELQKEVRDAEDKIQAARRFYNSSIKNFNNSVKTFPTNILASLFGFSEKDFFRVKISEEREVPKVEF